GPSAPSPPTRSLLLQGFRPHFPVFAAGPEPHGLPRYGRGSLRHRRCSVRYPRFVLQVPVAGDSASALHPISSLSPAARPIAHGTWAHSVRFEEPAGRAPRR